MAYSPNYAYPFPTFQPAMRIITNITTAPIATVTTSFAHQYTVGLIVRLDIPPGFGMDQANKATGEILTIPTPTTFTMSLDTSRFIPFSIPTIPDPPPLIAFQSPQVVPVGENNALLTGATRNVLPYGAS